MQAAPSTTFGGYRSTLSMNLGITQIVVGILCVVFSVVGFTYGALTALTVGFWGGVLFIVSGAYGISAAKSQDKCKITAFLVLCIISIVIAAILLICAFLAVAANVRVLSLCRDDSHSESFSNLCEHLTNIQIAMNALLIILAVVELIASIWGSALGGRATGCCGSPVNA